MMSLKNLAPSKLRLILTATLFLTLITAGVIFYFASANLRSVATAVSHKVADANASRNNLENLKKIERFLAEQQDTIARVDSIVADSQSYQYQDQIILDLNSYAAKAGIAITNFDFAAAATATPAAPVAGAPAATPAPATGGVKSTTVSISVANPVDYIRLLKFIKSIEQNLTKMQISKIGLSKGTNANEVSTDALTIEIYVR